MGKLRRTKRVEVFRVYGTVCVLCGRPGATDVHEVIVTRGMLPGREDDLTDPRNCVPLHNSCHLMNAHTDWGRKKCYNAIRQHFTRKQIQAFIDGLGMKNPPNLRRFEDDEG